MRCEAWSFPNDAGSVVPPPPKGGIYFLLLLVYSRTSKFVWDFFIKGEKKILSLESLTETEFCFIIYCFILPVCKGPLAG